VSCRCPLWITNNRPIAAQLDNNAITLGIDAVLTF
jgi:hypothetical protein